MYHFLSRSSDCLCLGSIPVGDINPSQFSSFRLCFLLANKIDITNPCQCVFYNFEIWVLSSMIHYSFYCASNELYLPAKSKALNVKFHSGFSKWGSASFLVPYSIVCSPDKFPGNKKLQQNNAAEGTISYRSSCSKEEGFFLIYFSFLAASSNRC